MRSRLRPTVRKDPSTRERLLQCAAQVFAEQGYEQGSVREVSRRARANIAAIHYHFGSKEKLYVETIRWAMSLQQEEEDTAELFAFAAREDLSPAERLVGTIRRFALGMLAPRPAWHVRLVLREIASPTVALDAIVREFLAPRFVALERALRPYLPDADEKTVALHVMSVIGQIVYHRVAGPVALRFLREKSYGPALAGRIVDHIAAFTLRSLEARAKQRGRRAEARKPRRRGGSKGESSNGDSGAPS
jgi:AcrR family transcriptional regulator